MRLIFDQVPRRRLWLGVALFLLAVFLALPALALASTALLAPTQLLPWQQLWPIVIGALVPLVTYVLNHWAPWVSEPIKAAVLIAVTAVATALYTALATNVIGFNDATLQLILTGVVGALAAHRLLWQPSGIAVALGAGSNRNAGVVAGGEVKPTPAKPPSTTPGAVTPGAVDADPEGAAKASEPPASPGTPGEPASPPEA